MKLYTSNSIGTYVEIEPIKAVFNNDLISNIIRVTLSDNLYNSCIIQYNLMNMEKDTIISQYSGTYSITDDNYYKWSGDTETVFKFLLDYLSQFGVKSIT